MPVQSPLIVFDACSSTSRLDSLYGGPDVGGSVVVGDDSRYPLAVLDFETLRHELGALPLDPCLLCFLVLLSLLARMLSVVQVLLQVVIWRQIDQNRAKEGSGTIAALVARVADH